MLLLLLLLRYLYTIILIAYVSETASPETFSSTDATLDVANFTGVENSPAATTLLRSEGKISRYLYGIEYPVKDLKLGILEASEGKIGSNIDKIILF